MSSALIGDVSATSSAQQLLNCSMSYCIVNVELCRSATACLWLAISRVPKGAQGALRQPTATPRMPSAAYVPCLTCASGGRRADLRLRKSAE